MYVEICFLFFLYADRGLESGGGSSVGGGRRKFSPGCAFEVLLNLISVVRGCDRFLFGCTRVVLRGSLLLDIVILFSLYVMKCNVICVP
jgi:hypothetical protein